MSETTQQQETVEQSQQAAPEQPSFNPFSDSSWAAAPTESDNQVSINNSIESSASASQEEEEILEPSEWLKREFSWESVDAAKQELEELRKLRESINEDSGEIEFENEESLNLFRLFKEGKQDEVYSYLETRRKLDNLIGGDLNRETASEIIKMNMQKSYPDLTRDEVEFKFNREFGIPQKPVQQDIETDEEYQERLGSWELQVKNIETELMIEAKLVKPDLQKYRNELVFPEIDNGQTSYEPTQEELEAQAALMDQFKESAIAALSSFDGFNVSVKDEEVEIPLSYSVSDEEKSAVASQIERFADANFDANVVLAERWLKEDGNGGYKLNTNQIIRDLTLLQSEGKVNQKFVNDAASKRLAEYIKKTSNVSVSSQTAQSTFSGNNKSDLDRQIEYIWKNS